MVNKSNRGIILFSILLLVGVSLFIFRYDLLFGFQRWRLGQLGCPLEKRIITQTKFDRLAGCQKLWAHRVDSYERFKYLSPYFGGLETDLAFDRSIKKFRICHPPAPTGELIADTYFKDIVLSGNKLWLDVKDLDSSDFSAAVHYFLECDRRFAIKQNTIIESSDRRFVNMLADRGFITSFLVSPTYLLETKKKGRDMHAVLLLPEVTFVSQEDIYLKQLKELFPHKKIITWAISFKNYFDLSHFRTLLKDTSVCVVLINIKSRHYK